MSITWLRFAAPSRSKSYETASTFGTLQQSLDNCAPFIVQIAAGDWFARLAIPIRGVRLITFATVQIGVDPRSIWRADVLRDLVSPIPVAAPLMPQGFQERRDAGRRCRRPQRSFELGQIHSRSMP
jgi:hypothetical protein